MHARVSTIEGPPDRVDEGIERILKQVLPAARELPGFQGILSLVDRQTGRSLTVTLWESEEAMRASEEAADRLRSEAAQELGATAPPKVERYEVVASEIATPARV